MADLNLDFLHSYSPAKRLLILLALIGALAGIFAYCLYLPKLEQLRRSERKLRSARIKLKQSQQIAAQLPKFVAEQKRLEIALKKALNRLPDNKEIPTLLLKITQLGKDAKLTFNLFQPHKPQPRDFYAEVPIDIEIFGSYHAVGRFFSQILAMPRIVNIREFKLSNYQEQTETAPGALTARFQAVTYTFIKQPAKHGRGQKNGKTKKRRRR